MAVVLYLGKMVRSSEEEHECGGTRQLPVLQTAVADWLCLPRLVCLGAWPIRSGSMKRCGLEEVCHCGDGL